MRDKILKAMKSKKKNALDIKDAAKYVELMPCVMWLIKTSKEDQDAFLSKFEMPMHERPSYILSIAQESDIQELLEVGFFVYSYLNSEMESISYKRLPKHESKSCF